ncbi:MAG TPA: VWA domain-containing protein [Candidatus Limnocylindrales bacterium]|nr:VWA domain-containing protein [Candidatus Limnocylindrales bacterium]
MWRAALLFASIAMAQDVPVFRSDVALVHVDAEVVSQDGRVLNGFTQAGFRVLDEKKPQSVAHFSETEELLDLILLFDISGSMKPKAAAVAAAAHEGLQELRPGDRVTVMVFNSRSRVVAPFSTDLAGVERSIQELVLAERFRGATFIQSALSNAATQFRAESRTGRRRAVLVITDNFGQLTRREETLLRELWEADAVVSGLIVRSGAAKTFHSIMQATHPYLYAVEVGIHGIADKTGGDFIESHAPGDDFHEAMRRLRTRYTLYYPLPDGATPGTARSIRVELSEQAAARYPKARLRARTGYVTPQSPATPRLQK